MTETRPTRTRPARRRNTAGCTLALILLCLLAGGGAWSYASLAAGVKSDFGQPAGGLNLLTQAYYSLRLAGSRQLLKNPVSNSGAERLFEIRQGESVGSIAYRLEAAGIIPDADAFRIYLIYSGLDRSLQAGKYRLSPAENPLAIARRLQDATPAEVIFAVLPGWRLEEAAASLPTSGLNISPDEFLAGAYTSLADHPLFAGLPATSSVEGFFFPGEYLLKRDASLAEVLAAPLTAFQESVSNEIRQGFEAQGLILFEAVTLASIVEREAVVDDEQAMIASVFYNRLADGMKLDSDPTVQYALGYDAGRQTWWKNPLTTADLQVDSPYNTYLYAGLPPGPISNPGLPALRAVAFPAETPYYYFRAKCDGSGRHEFAVTLDQHIQNACE